MTIAFAPYRQLRLELSKLETLYFASLHAYDLASNDLGSRRKGSKIKPSEQIIINPESFDGDPVSVYPSEFQRKLQGQFPKNLREIIFVRIISILEVFMIESLREVFIERRELFHSQDMLEFTQGEVLSSRSITVLWTKFINKELRRLQNQSLGDKAKYFKKKLSIDFNKYKEYPDSLVEIHDRRNLLVHRLGKADSYFKRQYNHTQKRIEITHEYLNNVMSIINNFAQDLSNDLILILSEVESSKNDNPKYRVKLIIEKKNPIAQGVLNPEFCFVVEEDVILLSDITELRADVDGRIEMILSGNIDVIKGYISILKKYTRRGLIEFFKQKMNVKQKLNTNVVARSPVKCKLSNDIIREIASRLPIQPWPQGIHKRIAEHYKTSNRQVGAAIEIILNDTELYALLATGEVFS